MITRYKIFEAKQVGILYHWTHFSSLEDILKEDTMWSGTGYISFSRNKRLNYADRPILIIFDGDKMSNKFKFESYLYSGNLFYKREAEERILTIRKDDKISGIKKYIIDIKVANYDKLKWEMGGFRVGEYTPQEIIELNEYIFKKFEKLNKLIPNIKIEIGTLD